MIVAFRKELDEVSLHSYVHIHIYIYTYTYTYIYIYTYVSYLFPDD